MVVYEDTADVASYAAQASVREFISFDTSKIAEPKVRYMGTKGHADVFFWDVRTPRDIYPEAAADVLLFACSRRTALQRQAWQDSNPLIDMRRTDVEPHH